MDQSGMSRLCEIRRIRLHQPVVLDCQLTWTSQSRSTTASTDHLCWVQPVHICDSPFCRHGGESQGKVFEIKVRPASDPARMAGTTLRRAQCCTGNGNVSCGASPG